MEDTDFDSATSHESTMTGEERSSLITNILMNNPPWHQAYKARDTIQQLWEFYLGMKELLKDQYHPMDEDEVMDIYADSKDLLRKVNTHD